MITIRDANLSDIAVIRELAEKTWWPVYTPIIGEGQVGYMLKTIYSAEAMRDAMENQLQTFLVLNEDDLPKGFASYGAWAEKPDTWKIHKLYVIPECHGKGFGKDLLNEIKERAKSNGVSTLVLNVNRQNPAFNFYQRYGFAVVREEDIPIGPYWMNDYVMAMPLT